MHTSNGNNHCPNEYSRLEIEEAETGKIITASTDRKTVDYFHSRLEISPNGKSLLSKGWIWHPREAIRLFDIGECISDPRLLDVEDEFDRPKVGRDVNTACFINDKEILIGVPEEEAYEDEAVEVMPANSFAIWNLETDTLSKPIVPAYPFGNLHPFRGRFAWDIFEYPKIIDIDTGEIVLKDESIPTGKRNSSIIHHIEHETRVAFDVTRTRMAIQGKGGAVTVLAFEE